MAQPMGQISPDGRWLWNGTQWIPNVGPVLAPSPIGWAKPYESASKRATWVNIFLLANIVGLLVGIALDFVLITLGSGNLTDNQTLIVGLAAVAFGLTYFGTFIPAVVFFCMWVHRVVRNMPALGAADPRWSPAGAVWRSFIPILSLVHPMSGTLDAWRGADPSRRWINVRDRKAITVPGLIIAWWASWLIGSWLSTIGGRLSNSNDAGTTMAGDWIDLLGSLVLIGAAVLAVLVVRRVTARQDRKNELITSGQLA